jgi:hypothetical protein
MRLTSWQERRWLEPACRAPAGALAFARAQARAASFVLTAAGGSAQEASFCFRSVFDRARKKLPSQSDLAFPR